MVVWQVGHIGNGSKLVGKTIFEQGTITLAGVTLWPSQPFACIVALQYLGLDN